MPTRLAVVLALALTACHGKAPLRPALKDNPGSPKDKDGISDLPSGGIPLNFIESRANLRALNYAALVNKLRVVTGLDDNSEALKAAATLSQSLGAYNHAAGVLPDTNWNLDRMSTWMQVADSACRTPAIIKKIEAEGGDKAFIEEAYGRDFNASDSAWLNELNSKGLAGPRRARILCTLVLLSAEFVSL